MPANLPLELRGEFRTPHMRGTAIELRNRQGTGWTQKEPDELLRITYPTSDVRRALAGVSTDAQGQTLVFLGQRGRGKSHIMALLHHAIESPSKVRSWTQEWGGKPGFENFAKLSFPQEFVAITETLSNQEYRTLWDLVFDRHPRGTYFRGRHEAGGTLIPAKSLMQDLFAERPTALILDEFQTWFDGLHDDPADTGLKRRQWAFNFVQILSELAKERPDLLLLIVSVRDTTTEGYRQIHRIGPVIIDFKGETAKEDRRKLLLHRLFENRAQFSATAVEQYVGPYSQERVRLLHADKSDAEKERVRREVVECWPFAPELLGLLDDQILLADSAQDKRDLIRVLAELFRSRGSEVPLLTPSDFLVDDDQCGVLTLLDSFATTADQEHLRETAIRNLLALQSAGVQTEHAREVISGIWVRSLSATGIFGGTREELQLDLTRNAGVNDNAFSAEVSTIVENSFNIHEVGTAERRYCFKLQENPLSKVKATAKNDKLFDVDAPAPPGLLPVMKDQAFIRLVLEHQLRSPDSVTEPPSRVLVLDLNWEKSPWANVAAQDMPERWDKPVLIVLPISPTDLNATLGRWLAQCVTTKRNMVRFLIPKVGTPNLYDDPGLRQIARCAFLAKAWKEKDGERDKDKYADIHRRFERDLRRELSTRFDRFALLQRWNYQQPSSCLFHVEPCVTAPDMIAGAVEDGVRVNFFALEDFEAFVVAAAQRGDTMKALLALLREPPAKPDQESIPYLGDVALYEQTIRVTAKDKIALRVGNSWYRADPAETEEQAFARLRKACFRTGRDLDEVELGLPEQIGPGGISIPSSVQPSTGMLFPAAPPNVVVKPPVSQTPVIEPPTKTPTPPPVPVIRQSNGAKSGLNLLGDLEKWALPDQERVNAATLVFRGLSVRELRELCTKIPSKLQAELEIRTGPEQDKGQAK